MPLQKIQMRPGVSRESTDLANEGGWYASDKIRFRSGSPEKLGGWYKYGEGTFLGTCRSLVEWESLSSFLLLGMGTNLKYYILSNQTFYDITPLQKTINPLPSGGAGANPYFPIYSTLSSTITASDTTIPVASGTTFGYAYPVVVRIGSEDIYVQNIVGNSLAGCTRGYNGTTAASHTSGTAVSSSWIAVSATANGSAAGNYVTLSGATAFTSGSTTYGTSVLNGNFEIKAETTDYIAYDTGYQSTATTAGGGTAVKAQFEIPTGAAYATQGAGWGAGLWISLPPSAGQTTLTAATNSSAVVLTVSSTASFPASGYFIIDAELIQYGAKTSTTFTGCTRSTINATSHGIGAVVQQVVYPSTLTARAWNQPATTGINIPLRLWSADTFGEDLVFNIRNGAVYYWSASGISPIPAGLTSAGAIVERGIPYASYPGVDTWYPQVASRVIVTDERHIVVLGTNDPTAATPASQDPLLVRWCEQEDPAVWEPTTLNTAGFQRLTYGSKLITAEKTRQEVLIWSDSALYSMRYLGPPYTFGFNTISAEINIASPNAVTTANNITYWMGTDKFYAYSGRVDTLPCALRQYIFDDINNQQLEQIYSGSNEKYNEVWWFYPSANSSQIDRYVIYNYLEKLWYYGQLARSSWYDSHIRTYPIATCDGILYYHEYGVDNATDPQNPQPIESYIESADFDIGEGDKFSFIKRIIPDMDFIGSQTSTPSVDITVSVRDFPGQGTFQSNAAETVNANEKTIQVYDYSYDAWIRLRGRQVGFRVGSTGLGVKWQLGVCRLDIQPDGRKGR